MSDLSASASATLNVIQTKRCTYSTSYARQWDALPATLRHDYTSIRKHVWLV